ncbi:MAG: hypothetical protein P4L56_19710 [Candidatus Sulfopaludibacter sp.]|nr:hypothetical protein [Candidatus Sulfopaludibacter sp.]
MASMDEEEFDAMMGARPFGLEDARRLEAQWHRSATLGNLLWGMTSADLQRQLLAPYPEIPSGFALADFRDLQRTADRLARLARDPRYSALAAMGRPSATITVGTEQFTAWEARCEVVRRAIGYLEKR